jgi:hypothetical protein
MRKFFSQVHIVEAVFLILVLGSLGLAILDPSTRPKFGELTEFVAKAYIGRVYLPVPKKRRQR